jgi:type II secretion system protein N
MLSIRTIMAWTALALLSFVVGLVGTFPYDRLQARLLAEASVQSGLAIQAKDWEWAWPAGLVWRDVTMQGHDLPVLVLPQASVTLRAWDWLKGRPKIDLAALLGKDAAGGGGQVAALVELDSWRSSGPAHISATVSGVDIGSMQVPFVTKGTLHAEFTHEGVKEPSADASTPLAGGRWMINFTNVVIDQVPVGSYTLPSIALTHLSGQVQCHSGACWIDGLSGEGPDGTIQGKGVIEPRQPVSESVLRLTLDLQPSAAYKQRVPLAQAFSSSPDRPFAVTLQGPLSRLAAVL